eukprot:TRINITY_DN63915_c0_g1_i1.p2 TRINITY_DN63915_c0_g1~~TRINITY_DN63915_c0_g1_i1.p2  ORF type:complete len:111 (+),score=3.90 TRINITY_DN63915_c0_g1_i1:49-333(+)
MRGATTMVTRCNQGTSPLSICMPVADLEDVPLFIAGQGVCKITNTPCVPAPTGAWVPNHPTVLTGENSATTCCALGGTITASSPAAQRTVVVSD